MLEQFGLVRVGGWRLSHRHKSVAHLAHLPGITFEVEPEARTKRNVVYAFTLNEVPRYIGHTHARSGFRSRLESYRYGNPLLRDTDNRVKKEITSHLSKGGDVGIWIAQPIAVLELPGRTVRVSGCTLLEELLIQELKPAFNVQALGQ
jgi:hypothetical protein